MLSNFTNQYQLSKTLRFELKPIGNTLEYIEQKGLLSQDEQRAENYTVIKEVVDKYHKAFIEESLASVAFNNLERFEELYLKSNKDEKEQKEFEKLQEELRKEIVINFKAHPKWNNLFKKELIKEDLLTFEQITDEQKEVVKEFANFTTYFTGFHENRANMYTDKEQHSSIAYRIVQDNFPTFLNNKKAYLGKISLYPEIRQNANNVFEDHIEGVTIDMIFELGFFNHLSKQRHIEIYNKWIGEIVRQTNLVRQANGLNKKELPNLKPLYKQILSDKETLSWLPEAFETQEELVGAVESFYKEKILAFECCDGRVNLLERFKEIFSQTQLYDTSKIFIKSDKPLTDISQALFKNYGLLKEALWQKHLDDNSKLQKSKKLEELEEKFFKQKYFTLSSLQEAIDFAKLSANIWKYFQENLDSYIKQIEENHKIWESDKTNTATIKSFLDSLINLQRFLKPLNVQTDSDKDIAFYSTYESYFEALSQIVKLYDKVRNFKTKKPYSLEKFKLNFENKGNFLGGWVDSKTDSSDNGTQYGGYLFRKKNQIGEYDYFLGVSSDTKLFRRSECDSYEYERFDYYQPKSTSIYGNSYVGNYGIDKEELTRSIEDFVFSSSLTDEIRDEFNKIKREFYSPSALIRILGSKFPAILEELYEDGDFKIANQKMCSNFEKTIATLHRIPSAKNYVNVKFVLFTEAQELIEELCQDKVFDYFSVSKQEMDESLSRDSKPLLLFKITNKDLSYAESFINGKRKSRGTDNLHTMYFKALMEGGQDALDIGTGEVFFRKSKYSDKIIVHKANEAIKNKNPNNDKSESKFIYDITKNRRFLIDKFQFHLSIIQNYKQPKQPKGFEEKVNTAIKTNDIKIIGIDRGERHLLYLSLIDFDGRIVEQYSLNQIVNSYNGKEHTIDYHEKLAKKEDERALAREQWGVIENIKELKEGYMSHVIHRIATLIVEHNAIVVLEDLNLGFKQGRFKVEKQVYQKFEKALIDKLNYLVDKKKTPSDLGGVLNALQLTNKFISFEKMGKQNGFLFYVPAWNTSKIDPVIGFVNLFDTRYSSVEKAKEFFEKFKSIRYNSTKDYFEFEFDYNDFHNKALDTQTKWTICTYGERIKTFRNKDKNSQWDNETIHLTTAFKNHFGNYQGELKEYILSQDKKEFFESLMYLFKLTLQMRNSITNSEVDYLISPVADKNGNFYDSRKADSSLPKDADANGAYNIARKGLMLVERIKQSTDVKKVDFKLTNKEWLQFAQRG